EPVAEASLADVLGMPVDLAVPGDQLIAGGGGLHEPAARRVIEQGPVTAPAERIAVMVAVGVQQQAAVLQVLDDLGVGVLEPEAGEGTRPGGGLAFRVD